MFRGALFAGLIAAFCVAGAQMASAHGNCQVLGFTVNDYGKEGPTNDAKRLLDKYAKDWTSQYGIKKYRTTKKKVSCYLFLDFGFFDEWTCTAKTNVCWSSGQRPPKPPKKK